MRKSLYFLAIALLTFAQALPAAAVNVFERYDKVIWIDQPRQTGAAYEKGRKLYSFPIMSGDDETPTPPGAYVVRVKDANYYSRKYKQPMSYSIFFDYKAKRAIHEGEVPDRKEMADWATHGCIHVEQPYAKRLFDWAEARKTLVVIRGKRDWALEEQIGQVDEGIHEDQGTEESTESEAGEKKQETQEYQENQDTQENQDDQDDQDSDDQ